MKSLAFTLLACLGTIFSHGQLNVQFNPIPASYNLNSANAVYALDVNYDSVDLGKQAFHLFLPDTVGDFPLVIYIHGGGFVGGSRDVVLTSASRLQDIKYFLDRGIAYASVGYRLLPSTGVDPDGVIKCLNDSKRAVQFIRQYANDIHINGNKIGLVGSSAGAGTTLWLATRSDMANPNATDAVERNSTRVCVAATMNCQATYDLYRWETDVYADFDGQGTNYTLDSMELLLGFDRYSSFYGGLDSTYHILHDPALVQYRQDVDMLYHMSSDDPPLYIENTSNATHPSQDLFHHAFHAREMNNTALAANLPEVKANINYLNINTTGNESRNAFLERHLNSCSLTTELSTTPTVNPINVYPNPAQNRLYIETTEPESTVLIYNSVGQLVLQTKGTEVAIENLSKGIYFLKIGTELVQFVKI